MNDRFKNIIINELYWIILLFPLWWVLGVEQFFWFFSISFIFLQFLLFSKFKFHINLVIFLFSIFLFVYGVSFFAINENMRYITYFRNISTYITSFMLLIITWNVIDKWVQIEKLLKAIVLIMTISSIIAIAAFFSEHFRFVFKSATGYLLPSFISDTGYGGVIANRNVGYLTWFFGLGDYFRPSSLFLYSTMFASTLAITLPVAMFFRNISSGRTKMFYSFVITLLIVALIFTTGRVAILSFILAYIIFMFLKIRSVAIKTLFILFLIFISFLFLFWLHDTGILYSIIDFVLHARGEGSVNTRGKIYVQTFNNFLERPFFGWGTERDIMGLAYPLGSHSYYLGTLYKQGVVGFSCFILIIYTLWHNTKIRNVEKNHFNVFNSYGRVIILVFIFNSFTDVLDLDATTMMFIWILFSLLLVSKKLHVKNL